MSVLISGVLVTPDGVPVPSAEITFTALTNGDSVLNGFSASILTDEDGEYSIPLELCYYSIAIQADGKNTQYGAISINENTTPTTLNELLKIQAMEQTVTPSAIVYFREIQADVTAKLAEVQSLKNSTEIAANSATAARDEAAQYAQNLSAAVIAAQDASTSATTAKNAAEAAAANAETALADAMKKSANGSDIADVEEFRANLDLGTAATSDVQETAFDPTANRLMLNGAWGLGGVNPETNTAANSIANTRFFSSQPDPLGMGSTTAYFGFHINHTGLAYAAQQIYRDNRAFYRTKENNVWRVWLENANLNGTQTFTAVKIFSYDGAGIVLRPVTTGAANFIRGQTEAGVNTWWCGRGSNTTQDVTLLNNIGGAYIRLLQNGNIELSVTSEVTINGIAALRQGNYGVGSASGTTQDDIDAASANGFYRTASSTARRYIHFGYDANNWSQIAPDTLPEAVGAERLRFRSRRAGAIRPWYNILMSNQYTVDANGFLKTASPIVKLFGDGSVENNEEATGVVAEKIETGVYRISGCLGLNSDATWGGIEGGLSIPKDRNELPILWIDYDVDAGGAIIVKTFHRVHANAPAFAQNRRYREDGTEYGDAEPIDIPHDVFVSVRVQMPDIEEPTPTISHSNVYCGTVSPSAV